MLILFSSHPKSSLLRLETQRFIPPAWTFDTRTKSFKPSEMENNHVSQPSCSSVMHFLNHVHRGTEFLLFPEEEWKLSTHDAGAHLLQGSMSCTFRDALLRTIVAVNT